MKYSYLYLFIFVLLFSACQNNQSSNKKRKKIDRYALVHRHNVEVTAFDTMSSLSVGNGSFAFTVDPTGLQTFADQYKNGVSLGTQSDWGWHSFPNPHHYNLKDVTKDFEVDGKKIPYVQTFKAPQRKKEASSWLRENLHRLDLGRIGWDFKDSTNTLLAMDDIQNIHQELNLWTGEIHSQYTIHHQPVRVKTLSGQKEDKIAVHAVSPLFKKGQLNVKIHFSYGSGAWDDAADWNSPNKHQTLIQDSSTHYVLFKRILDTTTYYVSLFWDGTAELKQLQKHEFELIPSGDTTFSFICRFSPHPIKQPTQPASQEFNETAKKNKKSWKAFWTTGGAVDLSGSTDPRAKELERRIILSQYLTRIQDAGKYPPQETGLTYNSWYGKFHLEMYFWHESHFALWNHPELLEKSLPYYHKIKDKAKKTAKEQGYEGLRWPKMTDPTGRESPSPIGPFLIWQEPHIIYMLELCYRDHPNKSFLEKYKDLVFGTAKFMASYPWYDSIKDQYNLGPALIPAQERFNKDSTINPTFELAYWYWGLSIAQKWRERLGMNPNKKWDSIMHKLSPLPIQKGVYLAAQSFPDTYTNPEFKTDHPSMLMAYGFLPLTKKVDTSVMRATLKKVMKVWDWKGTWGWDYPMVAMTATRLGMPKTAIKALMMDVTKNTFLPNGHNYQRANLRCYLPGNGSLLTTIALMCAGWDGYKGPPNPGFPKNGKWKVQWENLKKLP